MSTPIKIVEVNGLNVTRVEVNGVLHQHVTTPAEIQLYNELTSLRADLVAAREFEAYVQRFGDYRKRFDATKKAETAVRQPVEFENAELGEEG